MAWKTTKVASHHSKERNQTDRREERGGDVKQTSKGKVGGSISSLPTAKIVGQGQSLNFSSRRERTVLVSFGPGARNNSSEISQAARRPIRVRGRMA